jgi:hypothetical protein
MSPLLNIGGDMKKFIALALGFLTLSTTLSAAEEQPPVTNQYGYLSLGLGPAPVPLPQFGCGYRFQKGSNGFDANLLVTTVIQVTALKLGVDYLYYINPNIQKQFYWGIGPALIEIFHQHYSWNHACAIAPEFIFGKQYITDTGSPRHFQANVMWPVCKISDSRYDWPKRNHTLWYPVVSFSYAWGF